MELRPLRLNAADIHVLCQEIESHCALGVLQRVWDGRPGEVVLKLRRPGVDGLVLLAAGTQHARIHLIARRGPRKDAPGAFVQLLRKHLLGLRLQSVDPVPGDRVVRLELEGQARFTLVGELTGRHGNLFLLDEHGVILGSLRPNVSHRRKLIAAEPYVPPARPPPGVMDRPGALVSAPTGQASGVVADAFERLIAREERSSAHAEARRAIHKALQRHTRRLSKVRADLRRAEGAARLQRWGELLQAAYGKVSRGASSAHVVDYFDPELPPVEVPLEPSLSLQENITRYFKDAKRLKTARQHIAERMAAAEAAVGGLTAAEEEAERTEDPEALAAIIDRLQREGLVKPRPRQPQRPRSDPRRLPYHTFTSKSGKPILVGRGAKDNDRLTLRIGRGRDVWLHVDGESGSHVIVRLDRGEAIDGETLLDAATLAAFYSKRRGDSAVDVRYTLQKYVRKPKGVPPGTVTVSQSKVVAVRMEEDRVQRLFRSRGA